MAITFVQVLELWPQIQAAFARQGITITLGQATAVYTDIAPLLANLTKPTPAPTPTPTPAPDYLVVTVDVSPAVRSGTLTPDTSAAIAGSVNGPVVSFTVPAARAGWGAWLALNADGCVPFSQRIVLPLASGPLPAVTLDQKPPVDPPPVDPPSVNPPPVNPPPAIGDMIDVRTVQFIGGPNMQDWPPTAKITRLEIRLDNMYVEHTKQDGPDSWPSTAADGQSEPGIAMGPLQYSMGLVLKVNGQWYASAPIERWKGMRIGGGPIQSPGQIPGNWFYDNRWGALRGYQPQPGETIGFFVAAGDCRNSFNPVHERSNIVTFNMPAPGGVLTLAW